MSHCVFTRKGINEFRVSIHFGFDLILREGPKIQRVKWSDSLVTKHCILYVIAQSHLFRYAVKERTQALGGGAGIV